MREYYLYEISMIDNEKKINYLISSLNKNSNFKINLFLIIGKSYLQYLSVRYLKRNVFVSFRIQILNL